MGIKDKIPINYIEYKLKTAALRKDEIPLFLQKLTAFDSLPTNEMDFLIDTILTDTQFKKRFLTNPDDAAKALRKTFVNQMSKSQLDKRVSSSTANEEISPDDQKSLNELLNEMKNLKEKVIIYQIILCIGFTIGPAFTYVAWGVIPAIVIIGIVFPVLICRMRDFSRLKKLQRMETSEFKDRPTMGRAKEEELTRFLAGETPLTDCPDCRGTGTCSTCLGAGKIGGHACPLCLGTKMCYCQTELILQIRINAGIVQKILNGIKSPSNCPYCLGSGTCVVCGGRGKEKAIKVCPACYGNGHCLCRNYSSFSQEIQREIFNLLNLLALKITPIG